MQLQPTEGGFNVNVDVPYDIGQQVFAVDGNYAIKVMTVFSLVVRILETKDTALVVYGCRVSVGSGVIEYPAEQLFGTVQAAVDYVVVKQSPQR